jgi:hypothetical protein
MMVFQLAIDGQQFSIMCLVSVIFHTAATCTVASNGGRVGLAHACGGVPVGCPLGREKTMAVLRLYDVQVSS